MGDGHINPPGLTADEKAGVSGLSAANPAMGQGYFLTSTHYQQSAAWAAKTVSVAADRYILLSPVDGVVVIGTTVLTWRSQTALNLSVAATWDTVAGTDYTVAANRAGKNFYVYACIPVSGSTPTWKVSMNATAPSGYTTANSRKVGGFHNLCVAVNHTSTLTAWAADTVIALGETRKATVWDGRIYRCSARAGDFKTDATTEPNWAGYAVGDSITDDQITWEVEQHALEGYATGDILQWSVWDLKNRPTCSPTGMFKMITDWMDIYLQSGTGSSTASAYGGTITQNRLYLSHLNDLLAVGKMMPRRHQFMQAAKGSNFNSVVAGGVRPTTTGGRLDIYGRRMISDYGAEDCCGSHGQWLSDITSTAPNNAIGGGNWAGGTATGYSRMSGGAEGTADANTSARGVCPAQADE